MIEPGENFQVEVLGKGPVLVLECAICGAWVTESAVGRHGEFHNGARSVPVIKPPVADPLGGS